MLWTLDSWARTLHLGDSGRPLWRKNSWPGLAGHGAPRLEPGAGWLLRSRAAGLRVDRGQFNDACGELTKWPWLQLTGPQTLDQVEKACDTWWDLPKSAHGKSPGPANPGSAAHPGPRQLWPGSVPLFRVGPLPEAPGPHEDLGALHQVGGRAAAPAAGKPKRTQTAALLGAACWADVCTPSRTVSVAQAVSHPPLPLRGAVLQRKGARRPGEAPGARPSASSQLCFGGGNGLHVQKAALRAPRAPRANRARGAGARVRSRARRARLRRGLRKRGTPPSTSSRLWQPLAVCPWEKYLPSLGLGFLACKTGAVTQPRPPGVAVGTKCARARSTARRGGSVGVREPVGAEARSGAAGPGSAGADAGSRSLEPEGRGQSAGGRRSLPPPSGHAPNC